MQAQQTKQLGAAPQTPLIQKFMGVNLQTTLKCEETDEVVNEESTAFALKCNITSEVNHLNQGLALGLLDDREANSTQLGRAALFKVWFKQP